MQIYFIEKKRAYCFDYVEDNLKLFDKEDNVIILDANGKELEYLTLGDIFNYD